MARKYRPHNFCDLKGQDVLVRTISNAVKLNRIAHAFLLTGIRGVGKTTSARIIASILNCSTRIYTENNIINPCGTCDNCISALQEKHPDIIEIDAASRTGVADIRELIENVKYMPIMGAYKIYIIDEIHMLSTNAFNALLKTLEEPPAHVKFVFATTEIRKVPITIISRCQRFDLRRLSNAEIIMHLKSILDKENFKAEELALRKIAMNSEGSVRDSLSLLDHAVSLVEDNNIITVDIVDSMLGINDKDSILDLFEFIINADIKSAINKINELYSDGSDPTLILEDLIELTHEITKYKLMNDLEIFSESQKLRIKKFIDHLTIAKLTIIWQMLFKSIEESKISIHPLSSVEMIIVRLCYSSDLPTPHKILSLLNDCKTEELSNKLEESYGDKFIIEETINNISESINNISVNDIQESRNVPLLKIDHKNEKLPSNFKQLVDLFYQNKEMIIYHHLLEDVHLVHFEPRILKFRQNDNVPHNLANRISQYLNEWTGQRWIVTISSEQGELSLQEQDMSAQNKIKSELEQDKLVKHVLDSFTGSKIVKILAEQEEA